MGRLRLSAVVAGVFLLSTAVTAVAADLIPPPPPPIKVGKTWYLRGHIGMTNQRVGSLENVSFATANNLVIVDKNFESGMTFGLGVGIRKGDHWRFDLTGEYRGETGFHGLDTWTDGAGDPRFNNYTGKKSEWLFLANGYYDIGTWHGITPFVGAGLGTSRNTFHSFRDAGIAYGTPNDLATAFPTLAYADAASTWNFAWALHAGLGFQVNDNVALELGYSFVHLGSVQSGDIIAFDGTNNIYNPMIFNNLTSHDLKLTLRYEFDKNYGYQPISMPQIVKY